MTAELNQEELNQARARLLVVAALSGAPTGRRHFIAPERLAQFLRDRAPTVEVNLPGLAGSGGSRALVVHLESKRSFTLQGVIGAVPELARLAALGEELGSPASGKVDAARIEAVVRESAGTGVLLDRVTSLLRPQDNSVGSSVAGDPAVTGGVAAPTTGARSDDAIDTLFERVAAPSSSSIANTAIGAFVAAIQEKPRIPSSVARQVRAAIEDTVFSVAASILRDPSIARLEQTWRGLELLATELGADREIALQVLDQTNTRAVAQLEDLHGVPSFDRPDLILLLDPIEGGGDLAPWAELGEALMIPVLAGAGPALLGEDLELVAERTPSPPPPARVAWDELRRSEASRWLAVAANPPVVLTEGAGAGRRTVFGNPAVVVTAALLGSFRRTGTFGQVLGTNNAFRSPAVWTLSRGRESGATSPVEHILTISAQQRLASLGLIALGATRNSDRIVLSAAPAVRSSTDALPLFAQILSGRIVRFALWCRDQLEPGTPDDQVEVIFREAASALLFPSAGAGATFVARIKQDGEHRQLGVYAATLASYAGAAFELEFSLGSLP